jgi:hypothetical protein
MKDTEVKENKYPYNKRCKCGEKVQAGTIYLLNYYMKQNIINHGNCKLYKKHHYKRNGI